MNAGLIGFDHNKRQKLCNIVEDLHHNFNYELKFFARDNQSLTHTS